MKREGRIHGCNVRLGKRTWGYGGHGGKGILPSKPTNASKNSMKHPIVPAVAHIISNEHELPSQKAIGKTKSAFKAKDLDITRNYLMQDWRLYKLGLAVEESDDNDGAYHRGKHGKRWTRGDYGGAAGYEDDDDDDDEGTDDEQEQQLQEGEEECCESPDGPRGLDRATTEIVLPIESLLITRKRKIAPSKANTIDRKHPLAVGDAGGAEIVLDEVAADVDGDDFESWWGIGFYDGEDVPDDWFLITEGKGFVAA